MTVLQETFCGGDAIRRGGGEGGRASHAGMQQASDWLLACVTSEVGKAERGGNTATRGASQHPSSEPSLSCGINPVNLFLDQHRSSSLSHELPAPASVGQHLHLQPAEWLHVRPAETRPSSAPPAGTSLSARSGVPGPGQESRPSAGVGLLQLHQQCGEADGRLGGAGGADARVHAGQEPQDPAGHRWSPARLVRGVARYLFGAELNHYFDWWGI